MRNNVKAYKVCRAQGRRLTSASTNSTWGSHKKVYYRYGQLMRPHPEGNPCLFVFDTLADADSYLATYQSEIEPLHIFEVRAHHVRKSAPKRFGGSLRSSDFPRGTSFCSCLQLVKKL